ncbi:MAG: hypothetical protein GX650_02430 [Clostridiales bacterium]|nr:hypothetical protein [Clostridiales bacterium]
MNTNKRILRRLQAILCIVLLLMTLAPSVLAAALTGTVNADKVMFRTRANTSSDYHAKLNKGTKVALLDISGDFYKVRYDSKVGYIMKKFLTVSSGTLASLQKAVQPKSNSKYANTSSISGLGDPPKPLSYGDRGTDVEKLQRALQIKKFYAGVVDGGYGNQTKTAVENYQRKNGLTVNGKADYATIKKLFGKVGETTAAQDPSMNGITRISQIAVPNTTKKGDSGKHVKALQQALKLKGFYKAGIDSSYGDKTVEAVTAFQKKNGLSADGVAGNSTIRKLFGKDAANHTLKTEKLDWFNGGSNVIPKGAIFQIKDISSGMVFSMKRWSGANHLDAEPLTAKDTGTLKSVFGGDWSWARRSALVKYNGHVYAASINGMPHGTTTIDNNNFDGHICVHFYNSKTHETNRVDEVHQNAVARAMNYSW